MTLILSITTPHASVHASDRRVTMAAPRATPRIYSPLENKTIIFVAADAVGTIGFTGIAFVGQQPTDQWLANVLAPQPEGAPPLGSFAFGSGGLGRAKLRTIIWRLAEAMAKLPWSMRKYGLTVQVAGYRIRRRRSVPFCAEVVWEGRAPKIDGWMRLPRTRQQRSIVAQVGDGWPISRASKALADYAEATGRKDVEAIRLAAVEAIRERASETTTVGSDLMTVVVPNPIASREIVWRFEPEALHQAAIIGPTTNEKFEATYSPWIITPGSVSCPSIGIGGMDVHSDGFVIRCGNEIAPRAKGLVLGMSHQRRGPPPGARSLK